MRYRNFALIFVMLFVLGCENSNNEPGGSDLYTGTAGIELTPNYDKMPSLVSEHEMIVYSARIENQGPYSTSDGRLIISVDKGLMKFDDGGNYQIYDGISLAEKTMSNRRNDFSVSDVPIFVQTLDQYSVEHDAEILTTFCYDYRGIAVADICIDTDPYESKSTEKACSLIDSVSLSSGQGGPVVIDHVETRMLVDSSLGPSTILPQFKIYLANRGSGTVARYGSVREVCSDQPVGENIYNAVTLDDIRFSDFTLSDFDCSPEEVNLYQEEGSITCILKPGNGISKDEASYKTPLTIEISYGYMESKSKTIKIEKGRRVGGEQV